MQSDWEESLQGRCEYDGFEPDCMTFAYDVYARQADGGLTPSSIPTDEDDDRDYPCGVENLVPPPGPVEVGTVIRVTIVCGPRDNDDNDGDQDNDGSDGSSSDDGSDESSSDDGSDESSSDDGSDGSSSDDGSAASSSAGGESP